MYELGIAYRQTMCMGKSASILFMSLSIGNDWLDQVTFRSTNEKTRTRLQSNVANGLLRVALTTLRLQATHPAGSSIEAQYTPMAQNIGVTELPMELLSVTIDYSLIGNRRRALDLMCVCKGWMVRSTFQISA